MRRDRRRVKDIPLDRRSVGCMDARAIEHKVGVPCDPERMRKHAEEFEAQCRAEKQQWSGRK